MNKMRGRVVALLRRAWQLLRYPVLVVAGLIITALLFDESGVEGMTFVDWLDLLIIPTVLAGAAYLFNRRENTIQREIAQQQRDQDLEIAEKEREVDREIAREKRNEDILQNYLDKMTELMIDDDWLKQIEVSTDKPASGDGQDDGKEHKKHNPLDDKADRLFDIARVRTVSTLRALEGDTKRQTSVIHFLREAELLTGKKNPAVLAKAIMQGLNLEGTSLTWADLQGATLAGANLHGAHLSLANLQGAFLINANLQEADLMDANLQGTALFNTDLQEADLTVANLQAADLINANLQGARLSDARFDGETTLPDNTKWSEDVDMRKFTSPEHPEFWEPAWVKEAREKGEGRDE